MKVHVGDRIATKPGGHVATVTKVDGPNWVVVRFEATGTSTGFKGIDSDYWRKVKRPTLTGWKKTGICPSCKKRAITVGRCLQCGWVAAERKPKRKRAAKRRVLRRSKVGRGFRNRRARARRRLRRRLSRRSR